MKNLFKKAKRQKNFLTTFIANDKQFKSSDVNILLNRVKSNKKDEHKKKFYFSAITSVGLILFGLVVFY